MLRRLVPTLTLAVAGYAGAGCASTSPRGSFEDVAGRVEQRSGERPYWSRGAADDVQVEAALDQLLGEPLDVEQAVRVALLNNRTLTATYEELSISQAAFVQASLLPNPRLSAGMTTAEADRLSPNLEIGLSWDFLDAIMVQAKKKIAAAEREATKARVADVVLDVVADVKRAYFDLVAARQMAAMRQVVADAAQASADIASKQRAAGNINDLSLAVEESTNEQLGLDAERARLDVVRAREELTRLLGLWGARTSFRVSERLPDMPAEDLPGDDLEATAVAERLDLEAMRNERDAIGRTLSLVKSTRFLPGIDVGIDGARLTDGNIALAPRASLELPIFDQKQAVVARVEALFRAADDRLRARGVEVRSRVREANERMRSARATVTRYRAKVIPLRERVVALSQQQYDAMLLGVYQLIAAKQTEVSAYREAIEAARDYWLARVDLERAVAARFPKGGSR